jgi:Caspase domain
MRIVIFVLLITLTYCISNYASTNPSCHISPPIFESYINLKKIEQPTGTVKIKAILVICDNYITPDNNAIAQSLRVDLATVSQMLDILEKRKIAEVHKTVIQGSNATLANIENALNTIQTEKDDVILYYFSGHGFMEKGKTYMLTADEKNLGRDKVSSIIGSKNARLKMLISDCCSNSTDEVTVSRSINKSSQKIEAGEFDPIYKDLFLGYEGTMHLNAATEGEKAFSNNVQGGFFTYHLVKEGLIKKPINNWTDIFNTAKDKTSQMFMRKNEEEKSILASEGIKNQTPKAYSLPMPKSIMKSPNPSNTTPSAKINIYNFSDYDLPIFVDNNDPSSQWLESNTKSILVKSKSNISINQNKAMVGYEFKDLDYYFELEAGNYFLALDEVGNCELFIKDAHINQSNFSEVAITNFNTLLLGKWVWDDLGDEVITTFNTNGLTDEYPDEIDNESGTWTVKKEKIDGYEYSFITLEYEYEDSSLLLDYLIDYDEEFPDEIHLIFVSAFEDGQEIPYEEAEEFLEPSIVMYKIQ